MTKQWETVREYKLNAIIKEGTTDHNFDLIREEIMKQPHKTYDIEEGDYLEIIHKGKTLGCCDGVQKDTGTSMHIFNDLIIFSDGINEELYFRDNIDTLIFIKK